jgi:hypothetical protein
VDSPHARPPWRLTPFVAASVLLHAAGGGLMLRATARSAAAFDPAAQTIAGDTLRIAPSLLAAAATEDQAARERAERPAPAGDASRSWAPERGPHGAMPARAAVGSPPLFGAVGVRFATDLATTFTRAFPQAASADPVWTAVPFGAAGTADVTLVLDEHGRLVGSTIAGAPSPALRRGIDRTLLLLHARELTARGAVTRLRVRAHVSRDDVHDGLHGDVFALSGGSFSGEVGTAFFALPPSASSPGRRVDVEVRLAP